MLAEVLIALGASFWIFAPKTSFFTPFCIACSFGIQPSPSMSRCWLDVNTLAHFTLTYSVFLFIIFQIILIIFHHDTYSPHFLAQILTPARFNLHGIRTAIASFSSSVLFITYMRFQTRCPSLDSEREEKWSLQNYKIQ